MHRHLMKAACAAYAFGSTTAAIATHHLELSAGAADRQHRLKRAGAEGFDDWSSGSGAQAAPA